MPEQKLSISRHYVLTHRAELDLREARAWSLARWGSKLTRVYFGDLHKAAEYVATHHQALSNREDLTGDTGLFIHPVREHYLIYLPVDDGQIIIVAVLRQSRDAPQILGKAAFMIQREVKEIKRRIHCGELSLPE